jgi:hypothetical protein
MDTLTETSARILEIESRQDDALRQLAELERQIEQVLAACGGTPVQKVSDANRPAALAAGGSSTAVKAA